MSERVGLQSIAVDGIWLRREGEYAVVLAELDGKWVEVIREHVEGPFSHIVEPDGIKAKATDAPGVVEPAKAIGWGRGMFIAGAAAGVTPDKKRQRP
jgi:hypothetical protein